MKVEEIQYDNYIYLVDSQDTRLIKSLYKEAKKYDSFFVKLEDGDYSEILGLEGIVPYLHKELVRIK